MQKLIFKMGFFYVKIPIYHLSFGESMNPSHSNTISKTDQDL